MKKKDGRNVLGNIFGVVIFAVFVLSMVADNSSIVGSVVVIGFFVVMFYLRSKGGKTFIRSLQSFEQRINKDINSEEQKLPNREIEQNSYTPLDPINDQLDPKGSGRAVVTVAALVVLAVCAIIALVLLGSQIG